MSERQTIFVGLLIGFAIYTPVGIYLFDNSIATMLGRAYFTISGAAIALYTSPRAAVSTLGEPNG